MAPRPPVALAVGALVCAALAGCGGGTDPGPTTASPSEYIAAVQRLVEPPGQIASSIEERGRGETDATPSMRRLDRIVAAARDRLGEFRALRLGDPALRRQRNRLAGAYAAMYSDGVAMAGPGSVPPPQPARAAQTSAPSASATGGRGAIGRCYLTSRAGRGGPPAGKVGR